MLKIEIEKYLFLDEGSVHVAQYTVLISTGSGGPTTDN
jgi:hypothetical protein